MPLPFDTVPDSKLAAFLREPVLFENCHGSQTWDSANLDRRRSRASFLWRRGFSSTTTGTHRILPSPQELETNSHELIQDWKENARSQAAAQTWPVKLAGVR
ncbi:hypothetical protein M413DRAFT_437893 [Hebeloma cylindrosporum]|uniref:Uncharacterized protein n=1 Tax=Hebeloma cylindrosporum TaxID=76867 RepID=A0A0C2Z6B4_HEBCY|nr:hypothetical protein M413DRAFT_437893 [Hebeloma cylindrosporum h7]